MQENIDPINHINQQRTLSSAVESTPAKPVTEPSPGVQPASSTSAPTPSDPSSTPPSTSGFPKFSLILAIFIGVVALLIGVAAYIMGFTDRNTLNMQQSPTPEATMEISPAPEEEMTICTMDAMLCPDGSYVGRTGPQCEFVCPDGSNPEMSSSPAMSPEIMPLPASGEARLTF